MQPTSHAATCDFLNTLWKYDNVHVLRELYGDAETVADDNPETFFLAFGSRIRAEFWGKDADDSAINWDTVARFTDEWLDSDEYASMRTATPAND